MTEDINLIKQVAIEGRTEQALNLLIRICGAQSLEHEVTALQLKARHSVLEQQINEGTIGDDDKNIRHYE